MITDDQRTKIAADALSRPAIQAVNSLREITEATARITSKLTHDEYYEFRRAWAKGALEDPTNHMLKMALKKLNKDEVDYLQKSFHSGFH